MNSVNLIGRAGSDPDLKTFDTGKKKCSVSMAVDTWNGSEKGADWFDIQCWEKTADVMSQYIKKGSQFAVSGRLVVVKWETDSGDKRQKVIVVADRVHLIGKREDSATQSKPSSARKEEQNSDGLPF